MGHLKRTTYSGTFRLGQLMTSQVAEFAEAHIYPSILIYNKLSCTFRFRTRLFKMDQQ